jgi:UDP-N-acetylmuramoylalanine--D-glutamate ligase
MEEYIDAKKNIFRYHNNLDNKLVLNYDNTLTKSFGDIARGSTIFFSRQNSEIEGIVIINNTITMSNNDNKEYLLDIHEVILPGVHNIENYMAAIGAVKDFVKPENIKRVANTFCGVEHRIELVREINGIKIYNDSIASSPTRTIAGLNSFKQKVILMAGGCDKKLDYTELGYVMIDTIKDLVLVGQTSQSILRALENAKQKTGKGSDIGIYTMDSFENAVKKAFSLAKTGDVIIMSPASTSFDLFKNFEERGKYFKEIVMQL